MVTAGFLYMRTLRTFSHFGRIACCVSGCAADANASPDRICYFDNSTITKREGQNHALDVTRHIAGSMVAGIDWPRWWRSNPSPVGGCTNRVYHQHGQRPPILALNFVSKLERDSYKHAQVTLSTG